MTASPRLSFAVPVMGRFPKEFFPVGDLCFHAADAIHKRGEVSNAMGFRSKLEAGIVKQSNELIDAFRCVSRPQPQLMKTLSR